MHRAILRLTILGRQYPPHDLQRWYRRAGVPRQDDRRLDLHRREALLRPGICQPARVPASDLQVLYRVLNDDRTALPKLVHVDPRTVRRASIAEDQGMVGRKEADIAGNPSAAD